MLQGKGVEGSHGINLVAGTLANHTGEASSASEVALVIGNDDAVGGGATALVDWGSHSMDRSGSDRFVVGAVEFQTKGNAI